MLNSPGGIRVADDGTDNYGQMWMSVDKSIGYVLVALIKNYVVFIEFR